MSAGLGDADIRRLIDAFRPGGSTALTVEVGPTRLRLDADGRAEGAVETVVSPGVGLFHAAAGPGDAVTPEAEIGRIKSVRAETVVRAGKAGVIAELAVADGGFVDYGARLADLRVGAG